MFKTISAFGMTLCFALLLLNSLASKARAASNFTDSGFGGSSFNRASFRIQVNSAFHYGADDWKHLTSAAVSEAITTPNKLWAFLTDPRTPYRQRMAAAIQGIYVFPVTWLVRLVTLMETLQQEQDLHLWGLTPWPGKFGALVPPPLPAPLAPRNRMRHILGYLWVAPEKPTGVEPVADIPAEMDTAPWPLQLQKALALLYINICPEVSRDLKTYDEAYALKWYGEAFKLPCETDRQALRFVEVTLYPYHYKSLQLLRRWRQIALDPRFPEAAERVAGEFGEAMRMWKDPRAEDIGQAITCDILRAPVALRVKCQAAFFSKDLRWFTREGKTKPAPPMQVIVALGDLAINPQNGSEWDRLYCYVEPVCMLLPDVPIKEDINRLPSQSPRIPILLEVFGVWFRQHRAEFVREGEKQINSKAVIAAIRSPHFDMDQRK